MGEVVLPVLAGNEVVAYVSYRDTVELLDRWRDHGGQPPWDVRGRYPAEVRAAAEHAWEWGRR